MPKIPRQDDTARIERLRNALILLLVKLGASYVDDPPDEQLIKDVHCYDPGYGFQGLNIPGQSDDDIPF